MDLEGEKHIEMVEFDVDFTQDEIDRLKSYGLEKIQNDEPALINYAVNLILEETVKNIKEENKHIKEQGNG